MSGGKDEWFGLVSVRLVGCVVDDAVSLCCCCLLMVGVLSVSRRIKRNMTRYLRMSYDSY